MPAYCLCPLWEPCSCGLAAPTKSFPAETRPVIVDADAEREALGQWLQRRIDDYR